MGSGRGCGVEKEIKERPSWGGIGTQKIQGVTIVQYIYSRLSIYVIRGVFVNNNQ